MPLDVPLNDRLEIRITGQIIQSEPNKIIFFSDSGHQIEIPHEAITDFRVLDWPGGSDEKGRRE